jgi:uncharacterized oligopeptide transporter (OPT) family protein
LTFDIYIIILNKLYDKKYQQGASETSIKRSSKKNKNEKNMWNIIITIASALILVNLAKVLTGPTDSWVKNPICWVAIGISLVPVLNVCVVVGAIIWWALTND